MNENQKTQNTGSAQAAADAAPLLTPDQAIEQLRLLRAQMPNVEPLTDQERKLARAQARLGLSPEAVQASIKVPIRKDRGLCQ